MTRCFLLFLCLLAGQVVAQAPIVVVVSLDGVRHDYPAREGLPAFARLLKEGAHATRMTPVYPSNTFPGHVSLATGTYPDVHGITDNSFIDSKRGRYSMSGDASWLLAEPLWIASTRQGVTTATYFWVGSESDWRGQKPQYRMAPFDGRRAESEKVRQILEWLVLPEASRPRLIMSYFAGTDHVAHRFGPDSTNVQDQLITQDAALGTLLEGIDKLDLWSTLTLILVSDHGMTPMGVQIDLRSALDSAGVKAAITGSTVAHVYLENPAQLEAARAALSALEDVEVRSGEEAKALRIAPISRMGDLVVMTHPPFTFSSAAGAEGVAEDVLSFFGWDFGGHGYAPELPDMGAIFMAKGRGVGAGRSLDVVHQIDVAPTVAALLNIEPPAQSEGRVIELL
jgi:predicted AlkP superfamily pyrophosphatase or phosphodiesterase